MEEEQESQWPELLKTDRTPSKQAESPVRHLIVPLEEQNLFLDISRQLYINTIRYWIGWLRISFYKLLWDSPPSIEKHKSVIWLFPKPHDDSSLEYPPEDSFFASQRFCGVQTSALTRIKELPGWAPKISTLWKKCNEKNLFMVDYTVLGLPEARVPSAIGLFSYEENNYKTESLCIDGKVYDPTKPGLWTYAKACFQVNDSIYFFVVNRLCGAFLFLEPITLYFFRNIPEEHPLYSLLKPLFFGHATTCHW